MVGKITYQYAPAAWSQDEFLRLGGFVVVFLNYNKGSMIRESVASALNQDYPLLEMFFMDDASTDGSGDTMEALVRAYQGRHKVTVVRNTENQHICGQWNIVSQLATGVWYGMFCADDIAHPDRVSQVARLVLNYPDLLGVCTNVRSVNMIENRTVEWSQKRTRKIFVSGEESFYRIASYCTPIVGASAFWHKCLFEAPLPRSPLDDILLRCIVAAKSHGQSVQSWLWAGDVNTLTYTIGGGVTSEGDVGRDVSSDYVTAWLARRPFIAKLQRTWLESLIAAEKWMVDNRASVDLIRQVRVRRIDAQFQADSSSTFSELIAVFFSCRIPLREKAHVGYSIIMRYLRAWFGLRFIAHLERIIHPKLSYRE